MDQQIEIVGYLAMAFLVISFIPRQLKIVRIINLLGCVLFIAYGILLGWKMPIIISNGLIGLIQIYHLVFPKKTN